MQNKSDKDSFAGDELIARRSVSSSAFLLMELIIPLFLVAFGVIFLLSCIRGMRPQKKINFFTDLVDNWILNIGNLNVTQAKFLTVIFAVVVSISIASSFISMSAWVVEERARNSIKTFVNRGLDAAVVAFNKMNAQSPTIIEGSRSSQEDDVGAWPTKARNPVLAQSKASLSSVSLLNMLVCVSSLSTLRGNSNGNITQCVKLYSEENAKLSRVSGNLLLKVPSNFNPFSTLKALDKDYQVFRKRELRLATACITIHFVFLFFALTMNVHFITAIAVSRWHSSDNSLIPGSTASIMVCILSVLIILCIVSVANRAVNCYQITSKDRITEKLSDSIIKTDVYVEYTPPQGMGSAFCSELGCRQHKDPEEGCIQHLENLDLQINTVMRRNIHIVGGYA